MVDPFYLSQVGHRVISTSELFFSSVATYWPGMDFK